jgi:hypothetical protein
MSISRKSGVPVFRFGNAASIHRPAINDASAINDCAVAAAGCQAGVFMQWFQQRRSKGA